MPRANRTGSRLEQFVGELLAKENSQNDHQPQGEAQTQRIQARTAKCHGHFTDIDRAGNCLYCGGKPGGSAVRRTNEDN